MRPCTFLSGIRTKNLEMECTATASATTYRVPNVLSKIIAKEFFDTNLHSYFGQLHLVGQLFTCVHIRVVTLLERLLELVQLERGERGAIAALLLRLLQNVFG